MPSRAIVLSLLPANNHKPSPGRLLLETILPLRSTFCGHRGLSLSLLTVADEGMNQPGHAKLLIHLRRRGRLLVTIEKSEIRRDPLPRILLLRDAVEADL